MESIPNNEFMHELIMPNEGIPIKIFCFSAHNDLRIIPSHWHRSAEILFVKSGKLNIWLKDKQIELKKNDFIYINSKEVHSTQSPEDSEVLVLQIPGDLLETFSNKESLFLHCNTVELDDDENFAYIRELLNQMYKYSHREDHIYYLKVYSLLFELGYILVKNFRDNSESIDIKSKKYLDRLSEICEYMKTNYQDNLTLNEVAQEFGYTPQYLAKLFQKYTGKTVLTYLNSIRLSAAYKQIMGTDYPVLLIAETNGFANVKSLNKLFKDTYGVTPSSFRKNIKK